MFLLTLVDEELTMEQIIVRKYQMAWGESWYHV